MRVQKLFGQKKVKKLFQSLCDFFSKKQKSFMSISVAVVLEHPSSVESRIQCAFSSFLISCLNILFFAGGIAFLQNYFINHYHCRLWQSVSAFIVTST